MQLESIAGFGAVIDRLGQFTEVTAELQPAGSRHGPLPDQCTGLRAQQARTACIRAVSTVTLHELQGVRELLRVMQCT